MGHKNELVVLVPVANGEADVEASMEALLNSEGLDGVPLSVLVLSNGSTDRTVERAQTFVDAFQREDWHLSAREVGAIGKVQALKAGLADIDPLSHVLVLDIRIRVHPRTIAVLLKSSASGSYDVISGDLKYPLVGNGSVKSFIRGYRASPYARSTDLKGTCVLFSPGFSHIIKNAPDVAAEDRYFLSQVSRTRRGKIAGASVDYFFPKSMRDLLNQQARWVSSNKYFDETHPVYERNEHEVDRRRYFGHAPPPHQDRIVYFGVMVLARLMARLRPTKRSLW